MTSIYEYHSVSTPRIKSLLPVKTLPRPKLSFAEAARLENKAAREGWDHPNKCPSTQVEQRKAVHRSWLEQIPPGKHLRAFFRAAWPEVSVEGADSRMDILVREGHLIRHPGKPATWERT